MRSKKRILLLLSIVVLLGLIIWRYLTTRDNYVLRDLRLQIAQIEHQDYIESVSVGRRPYPPYARFVVTIIPGQTDEMVDTIAHELIEKLDAYVHYGAFKRGEPNELFPGNITLAVKSTDADGVYNGMGCERGIVFQGGKPTVFEWHISQKTRYDELTRPYTHPWPEDWYNWT